MGADPRDTGPGEERFPFLGRGQIEAALAAEFRQYLVELPEGARTEGRQLQLAAGGERFDQAGHGLLGLGQPLDGGVRGDQVVARRLGLELLDVAGQEVGLGDARSRLLDHRRREIDGVDLRLWEALVQERGQVAGSATEIEDRGRLALDSLDQALGHSALDDAEDVVVDGGALEAAPDRLLVQCEG